MRFMLAVFPFLLLPCVAAAGERVEPVPQRIPFELRASKLILPVTLGGSRKLRIVLDTGMAQEGLLLYDDALLDSIPPHREWQAAIGGAGSGPPQTARVADSLAIRIGGVEFTGQRVIALRGSALRGFASDGVCGHSLLARHAVEIDYGRMELVLHPPGRFHPDSTWAALPLRFKENRIPWVDLTASVRAPDSVALACYIDLASSETVEFLTRDAMKFTLPDSLEDVYLGRGLSGDIHGRRGRIGWVRLGPARLDGVVAAFTPAAVRSKQPGADAVVGNGLLRRFDCIFDYAAERLYLRPNAAFGDPW